MMELSRMGVRSPNTESKDAVPVKYRTPETSGITLTVKAGRNPEWLIDIPEGLQEVKFPKASTFEAQKKN